MKYNKPLYVIVPTDQMLWWRARLQTTLSSAELLKFQVVSKNANAFEKSDEEIIKTRVRRSIGFAELDKEVFNLFPDVFVC